MEKATIITLLHNSGIEVTKIDNQFIYFKDPGCLLPAFDTIFHYAWIVCMLLVIFILLGWAVLYIKNGVKLSNFFGNIKTLFLVLMVFSLTKPAVDFVYGANLFATQCEIKKVSMYEVNKLLDQRNKNFSKSDQALLYETFNVTDTGVKYTEE